MTKKIKFPNRKQVIFCDQCEKSFTEDQMTATGGDEIYCQTCYPEKVAEADQGETE
jgi:hypothetical protein